MKKGVGRKGGERGGENKWVGRGSGTGGNGSFFLTWGVFFFFPKRGDEKRGGKRVGKKNIYSFAVLRFREVKHGGKKILFPTPSQFPSFPPHPPPPPLLAFPIFLFSHPGPRVPLLFFRERTNKKSASEWEKKIPMGSWEMLISSF